MHECVSSFIDAVESGKPGSAGPDDLIKLHEIALAVEASKDLGGWQDVKYS